MTTFIIAYIIAGLFTLSRDLREPRGNRSLYASTPGKWPIIVLFWAPSLVLIYIFTWAEFRSQGGIYKASLSPVLQSFGVFFLLILLIIVISKYL